MDLAGQPVELLQGLVGKKSSGFILRKMKPVEHSGPRGNMIWFPSKKIICPDCW
jgi:hypothetical protein